MARLVEDATQRRLVPTEAAAGRQRAGPVDAYRVHAQRLTDPELAMQSPLSGSEVAAHLVDLHDLGRVDIMGLTVEPDRGAASYLSQSVFGPYGIATSPHWSAPRLRRSNDTRTPFSRERLVGVALEWLTSRGSSR